MLTFNFTDGTTRSFIYASIGYDEEGTARVYNCTTNPLQSTTKIITPTGGSSTKAKYNTFVKDYGPDSGYSPSGTAYILANSLNVTQRLKLWDNGCYGPGYTDTGDLANARMYCAEGSTGRVGSTDVDFTENGISILLAKRYGYETWVYCGTSK